VLNLFCSKKITGFSASFLLAAAALLAGCGSGGVAGTAGPGTAAAPSITVALTDSTGATITSISNSAPSIVKATVKDAGGAAVANAVVTFSTDATKGSISPTSALTDANGVATVTLSPASLSAAGAATITATSLVGTPATEATGSTNYSVSAAPVSSITVALTSSAGTAVNSISSGAPATVKATVKDTTGAGVANAVVAFSNDREDLATITPASQTALTDANGVATVTLSAASLTAAGAGSITAVTQVGTAAVTGSINYSVGAANVVITSPVFGLASLSAFGTTSVTVTVSSDGSPITTPQIVSFTSPCASNGKAVLTPSVTTVNGVATASYRDNGCAGADTVTASISGITPSMATLNIAAPSTGSIQFVSATPTSITLKGMGGVGRQESAQVVFKAVDTAGNPIGGKTVSFSLNTSVGGITLTTATAISDPTTGEVVVGVNAGTVSTPVRVIASTCTNNTSPCTGTLLATQSDQLTITTGIPDQHNFSLSATVLNIEGWNYDGTTTVLTSRLADHFNNPVPNGTAVNFTSEGGSVVSSCITIDGACSATLTSQALRPSNGRLTVLAYAVGEEGFTDLNGNGLADNPTEMFDANGASTDMPEAFVDYNENGVRNTNEPFTDFNQNGVYNSPDGQYNGVLCNSNVAPGSSATACSAQKGIHVRGQMPIVFSSSDAFITINGNAPISLPSCFTAAGFSPGGGAAGGPLEFTVTVVDINGNAMPAGTRVEFTADNGTVTSDALYTVQSTSGCRPASAGAGGSASCPASAASSTFGNIQVVMKSNATFTAGTPPAAGTCADTNNRGTLRVKVTTPKGNITSATATVTD